MWGSFKSFFVQESVEENNKIRTTECDETDGWVIVDMDGNEVKKESSPTPLTPKKTETLLSPLPLLDISNTSSPQNSPQLSPTKIEEGWFVAPPPCFVMNCPNKLEVSPLENLLIEHPSMSVYHKFPGYLNDKSAEEEAVPRDATNVINPKTSDVKAFERTSKITVWETKNASGNLQSTNSVQRAQCLDLKSLVDQSENTKPSNYTKWEGEQYKLCPSYINRQNRVHRYQSRKHHNQKKKSLAKPFAEKGSKHTF